MHRRTLLTSLALLGLGGLMTGCSTNAASDAQDLGVPQLLDATVPAPAPGPPLATPLADFAGAMTALLAPAPANLLWSPWSVAMALAMVRDGARGDTLSEMSNVLGAEADFDARLADGWQRMAHATGEPLHAANSVWVQSGLALEDGYRSMAAALSASLKLANFQAGPDQAKDAINAWVQEHTAGKIKDLLAAGMITSITRLVAVNALHFAASWEVPFGEPGPAAFQTPTGSVPVPFLAGAEPLPGWQAAGWTSAVIPCEHHEFSLVVTAPDDPKRALRDAPHSALGLEIPKDGRVRVVLSMPAWKLASRSILNDSLAEAGMPQAFDERRADFSGITADEPLVLSTVVHEATIEVTATGIEASAATAAVVRAASAQAMPIPLDLNRPFAYALIHSETRTPLLVGHVVDPSKTEAA